MNDLTELAFRGDWNSLLPLLRQHPDLVTAATESKAYTVLHQAAWHGASLPVIGELLALGADPHRKTSNKHQTAQDIAIERHPNRPDLDYILTPRSRSVSQMMRKLIADNPSYFSDYDGNRIVCDVLMQTFTGEICNSNESHLIERVEAAIKVITGTHISTLEKLCFEPSEGFRFSTDAEFWRNRFIPALEANVDRARVIPIEEPWATISDLFDPAPAQWGLRGDFFLWLEMRRMLCQVRVPDAKGAIAEIIAGAHQALTGAPLSLKSEICVPHLARGGMSSGAVSGEFWIERAIPLIENRLSWLREAWSATRTVGD